MEEFLIQLSDREAKALRRWAKIKMRLPLDQIRFVLRQALERDGLLPMRSAYRCNDAQGEDVEIDYSATPQPYKEMRSGT